MSVRATLAILASTLAPAIASAQPAAPAAPTAPAAAVDDGYCDFVEGTASANAATLYAPELFGQFGRIEQTVFAETPSSNPGNLRVIDIARRDVADRRQHRGDEDRGHDERLSAHCATSRVESVTDLNPSALPIRITSCGSPRTRS